uniref:Uncharacterized protein n=1 Tax=Salmo trutta TaxID=8032 RepID=A0A674A973_SALTR
MEYTCTVALLHFLLTGKLDLYLRAQALERRCSPVLAMLPLTDVKSLYVHLAKENRASHHHADLTFHPGICRETIVCYDGERADRHCMNQAFYPAWPICLFFLWCYGTS